MQAYWKYDDTKRYKAKSKKHAPVPLRNWCKTECGAWGASCLRRDLGREYAADLCEPHPVSSAVSLLSGAGINRVVDPYNRQRGSSLSTIGSMDPAADGNP